MQHSRMLQPRINDRVETPAGDDKLPAPDRSLKNADCSTPDVELLTVTEVAELLRVSAPSVRRLQQRRRIPFVKIGGCVRFNKNDIVSYLAKQRVQAVD
ncbi:helix-turn-helix domain-containing protein [Bradyrhizobium sp. 177]|nr:helix-turn-helix domain-containing protein [Bradyrhizobium sp. 177]